jgi:hypothetical protein
VLAAQASNELDESLMQSLKNQIVSRDSYEPKRKQPVHDIVPYIFYKNNYKDPIVGKNGY